jgi:hypothetical protein
MLGLGLGGGEGQDSGGEGDGGVLEAGGGDAGSAPTYQLGAASWCPCPISHTAFTLPPAYTGNLCTSKGLTCRERTVWKQTH